MATPISEIKGIVQGARDFFDTGATKSYEWRVSQLQALCRMMSDNKQIWEDAMTKDLSQNRFLKTTEVQSTITEAQNAISNLKDWMKPQKQENLTVMNVPGTAMIVKEPFGTVLIISPFNYPVSLLTKPLVGALAAGNCAILKPSELTPSVADAFAKLVPKYLDQRAVRVILGAIPETTELLKQVFDYILYTGNPQVAKIIMRAAAENLTPVTLELGGKSPCIIDKQVDLDVAAKRITWGKFLNNGQTCVAPDYLFVHKDVKSKLIEKMKQNVIEFYGQDPKQSPDYSRIVSERHTQRLAKLLEGNEKKIIIGGQVDISQKYIAPTLIDSPSLDTPLMQEEIFGPILPVLTYDQFDDVIDFINKRPKPLALYLFSSNSTLKDDVIKRTSSGATVINDVVVHNIVDTLPFGGVGNSGMGAYNGRFTFDTFSHNKTVFVKPTFIDPFARYPPYNDTKIGIVSMGLGWSLKGLKTVAAYTLPVIIGGITYYVLNSKL